MQENSKILSECLGYLDSNFRLCEKYTQVRHKIVYNIPNALKIRNLGCRQTWGVEALETYLEASGFSSEETGATMYASTLTWVELLVIPC